MKELEGTLADLRTLIADYQNMAQIWSEAPQRKVVTQVLLLLRSVETEIVDLLQRERAGSNPEERAAAVTKIATHFKSVRDYLESQTVGKPH